MHPYLKVDYKYNSNYYNIFIEPFSIKSHSINPSYKKNLFKKTNYIGGMIYSNNNNMNYFDIKYDSDNEYGVSRLFVGNGNKGCFLGLIDKYQPDELIIQDFNYNKTCNVKKKLSRGDGMRNLMNVIKKYIMENLKQIKKIRLTDKALLECYSSYNNKKNNIILSNLYFLKHMNTYYSHKYNFLFDDKNMKNVMNKNLERYKKFKLDKNKFVNYLKNTQYEQSTLKLIIENDVNLFFEDKNLLNYNQISEKLKNNYNCLFLKIIINYIFNSCKLINIYGEEYYLDI